MIKVAHSADYHWRADMLDKCVSANSQIFEALKQNPPNVHLIAGDFWESPQMLTDRSSVNIALAFLQKIGSIAPTFIVKGNNEHDAPGSLEILSHLNTLFPVTICTRTNSVVLLNKLGAVISADEWTASPDRPAAVALIHMLAYPYKSWFLADEKGNLSIDETNARVLHGLQKIFISMGVHSAEAHKHDVPVLFVGHLHAVGATKEDAQEIPSQDIMISSAALRAIGADYYALGHIHTAQEIIKDMHYAGNLFHRNRGELAPKSFNMVMVSPHTPAIVERIPLQSRPMMVRKAHYDPQLLVVDTGGDQATSAFSSSNLILTSLAPPWKDAEIYVDFHCTKEQSKLVSDERITDLYSQAYSVKIRRIHQVEERIRSVEITKAQHLRDKVLAWGRATSQDIPGSLLEKADALEGGGE